MVPRLQLSGWIRESDSPIVLKRQYTSLVFRIRLLEHDKAAMISDSMHALKGFAVYSWKFNQLSISLVNEQISLNLFTTKGLVHQYLINHLLLNI